MDSYRVDDRPPWYEDERKRDWLIIAGIAPVFAALWHFSTREQAVATSAALFLFYALISRMWNRSRERWFWIALSIFALIHITVIWFVPFQLPAGPSITYILPAMMADGFGMWGILNWLQKRFPTAAE